MQSSELTQRFVCGCLWVRLPQGSLVLPCSFHDGSVLRLIKATVKPAGGPA